MIITTPPEPHTFNVRTETVTITDSGRKNQQMDKVLLSNYYNVVQLYKNGYTKIHVTFSFDVKEIDDGYQYVFLYSDANCRGNGLLDKIGDALGGFLGSSDSDDPSLLYVYKFEHGAGKKDTSWKTHTFTTTLSTGSLKDDLYIRYGASGKNDDDWQNKNVTVYVELSN